MPNAGQEAPSVISVNMHAASAVVLEFLARAFPFRLDGNVEFARVEYDLASEERNHVSDGIFASDSSSLLGIGLRRPLLDLPALEDPE